MRRRLGSGVAVAGGNALILVTGILTGVLAARMLAPAGRGEFLTWQTWAVLGANLANFGFAQAIVTTRVYPRLPPRRQVLALLALIGLGTLLTWAAFGVLLGAPPAAFIGGWLFAFANSVAGILPAVAQRLGRMVGLYNVLRVVPQLVTAVVLGVLFASGVTSAATTFLVIGVAQALTLASLTAAVVLPQLRPAGLPRREFWLEGLRLGPPGWALYACSQADLILVTLLFGSAEVAYYGIAMAAQGAVFALGQSVAMRWFSLKGTEARIPGEIFGQVVVAGALPALVAVLTASWFVPTVFGAEFAPAVPVVMILVAGGFVRSLDALLWYHAIGHTPARVLTLSRVAVIAVLVASGTFMVHLVPGHRLEWLAALSVAASGVGLLTLYAGRRGYRATSRQRVGH